jgi:basic membrane protein A
MDYERRRILSAGAALAGTGMLGLAPRLANAADPLRVGVLIPGSKSDKGFMQSGYDGLVAAQAKHGAQLKVSTIENVKDAEMEQAFTALASKSALVIGVGGQCQAAITRIAPRFPKVRFSIAGSAGGDVPSNVAQYDPRQAEIAFMAGAGAALLSKTGAVSYVGGFEIPAIVNAGKEFGNGAKYVKPDIRYFSTLTGDFDDITKAKEATLSAISQGADIHYHILNSGLRGIEQAATEKGTHIIGGYSNYCGINPLYVAYSVSGIGYQVQWAIDRFMAGDWQPGVTSFGLAKGPQASDFIICSGATPAITAKLNEIRQDLLAGKIKTLLG